MKRRYFWRKGDWYFEGYRSEIIPASNRRGQKRTFIYEGDYYSLGLPPKKRNAFKLCCFVLYIAAIATYLTMMLTTFTASAFFYVGIPSILAVIPLIYLGMGVVCLIAAPEQMTLRIRYSSLRRIGRATCCSMVFLSISLVGDLAFLIQYFGHYLFRHEIILLLLNTASLILLTLIWVQIKRHPARPIKAASPESSPA